MNIHVMPVKNSELLYRKTKSKSGFESEITYYECGDCEGCPYKKEMHPIKGQQEAAGFQEIY